MRRPRMRLPLRLTAAPRRSPAPCARALGYVVVFDGLVSGAFWSPTQFVLQGTDGTIELKNAALSIHDGW